MSKIFVGGLNINTTTENLKAYFEKFGEVSDAIVMRDNMTNKSRCFGFVTFGQSESVDQAQANRPHTIDGKQVDTKRAIPKDEPNPESRVPCKKIFVGGLRRELTDADLQNYFSRYGTITECNLVVDKTTGLSRGFAFIGFEDQDSVDKIILDRPHTINDSKADVKKALSKEEMNAMKPRQSAGPPMGQPQPYQQQQYGAPQGNGYGAPYGQGYGYQGGYGAPNAGYQQQQPPMQGGYDAYGNQQGGWGQQQQVAPVQAPAAQGYQNPYYGAQQPAAAPQGYGAPPQQQAVNGYGAPQQQAAGGPVRGPPRAANVTPYARPQ